MSWLSKLLGQQEDTSETSPADKKGITTPAYLAWREGIQHIRFGRYSDNNKTLAQTRNWYVAEDRFKEKAYPEAHSAFFNYLADDKEGNVIFRPDGQAFSFTLLQGSKKIHGESDGQRIIARAPLAAMDAANTAVMRRLLELNYTLYYSHTALDAENTLYMVFESAIASASPNKLYYGLRELATKADRQDDLLLSDFDTLKAVDTEHIQQLPAEELDIKYAWFRKWIEDTLADVTKLNADSFSGSIAYLLLTLIYRIDFLILPEAALLLKLEKINALYWEKKDETALVERNALMVAAIRKLLDVNREEFAKSVYRSKATFSLASHPKPEKVKDNIISANKDSQWYVENKYPALSLVIIEYGLLYNQFISSMPKVQTDLITIFMAVMHPAYFAELGLKEPLYDAATEKLYEDRIKAAINEAIAPYQDKYKSLNWDHSRVAYDSMYDFAVTFSEHLANMNLETKRED